MLSVYNMTILSDSYGEQFASKVLTEGCFLYAASADIDAECLISEHQLLGC